MLLYAADFRLAIAFLQHAAFARLSASSTGSNLGKEGREPRGGDHPDWLDAGELHARSSEQPLYCAASCCALCRRSTGHDMSLRFFLEDQTQDISLQHHMLC